MRVRDAAKVVAHRAIEAAGYEVRRRDNWRCAARCAARTRLMERCGVKMVLDVGASDGQWARHLRSHGYDGAIVSFEPLSSAFTELERASRHDATWRVVNVALGAATENRRIHVSSNLDSSSLLDMEDAHRLAAPHSVYVADQDVVVMTLDEVCDGWLDASARLYLKLDVQGFEMDVLHGARRALSQVSLVEMELTVTPLYRGQVLYREMMDYLGELGFDLIGLHEEFVDPRNDRLLQFDAFFERTVSDSAEGVA